MRPLILLAVLAAPFVLLYRRRKKIATWIVRQGLGEAAATPVPALPAPSPPQVTPLQTGQPLTPAATARRTAVALAAVSFYLRATGGAVEALAPAGVTLSAVTVVILVFTGWLGGELVYRHRVGIEDGAALGLARAGVSDRTGR